MQDRLVEITADRGRIKTICKLAERDGIELQGVSALHDGKRTVTMLVSAKVRQKLFDDLQAKLNKSGDWRMVVLPVEAIVPEFKPPGNRVVNDDTSETREELYEQIEQESRTTRTSMLLIVLSAIVASVGMIQDSIPVVIGAMVIAPLLAPILAVILGTALGEWGLIVKAASALAIGISLAIAVGVAIGLAVPFDPGTAQIAARTAVGPESAALALASGAAAALSAMTGVSAILVGVMVAAALLPPAVAVGLLIGKGAFAAASGAGLMLGISIAALTLAGQIVFLLQGVRPRTWYRMKEARQSVAMSLLAWTIALVVLGGLIFLRNQLVGG